MGSSSPPLSRRRDDDITFELLQRRGNIESNEYSDIIGLTSDPDEDFFEKNPRIQIGILSDPIRDYRYRGSTDENIDFVPTLSDIN